ncbi:DUF2306 domain-containing protein [Agrobacterium sp. SORGH_AS 787]|uniref:DUF2306 domain-containing protein n=1 Tax=Agrobacterium sp. SORGH_AS 787 TaxID=3041775 RepID=UPI0032B78F1C
MMMAVLALRSRVDRCIWAVAAVASTALALVSYRYLTGKGPIPPNIAANRYFDPWIAVHAAGAATALLLGPWQFLPGVRTRWPWVHRYIGRLYTLGCASGGLAALVLVAGQTSGLAAGAGFTALSLAWLTSTGLAVREVLAGRVVAHRRWMIRSFALTLSAITLRIYVPLADVFDVDFLTAYRTIAWACWVPNVLLAEIYLLRRPISSAVAHPVTIPGE